MSDIPKRPSSLFPSSSHTQLNQSPLGGVIALSQGQTIMPGASAVQQPHDDPLHTASRTSWEAAGLAATNNCVDEDNDDDEEGARHATNALLDCCEMEEHCSRQTEYCTSMVPTHKSSPVAAGPFAVDQVTQSLVDEASAETPPNLQTGEGWLLDPEEEEVQLSYARAQELMKRMREEELREQQKMYNKALRKTFRSIRGMPEPTCDAPQMMCEEDYEELQTREREQQRCTSSVTNVNSAAKRPPVEEEETEEGLDDEQRWTTTACPLSSVHHVECDPRNAEGHAPLTTTRSGLSPVAPLAPPLHSSARHFARDFSVPSENAEESAGETTSTAPSVPSGKGSGFVSRLRRAKKRNSE